MTKLEQVQTLKNKINEIKCDLNSISSVFIEDYKNQYIYYIGDEFHSFADNNTSIYYYEQREFYYNNIDVCNDAINEYYGSFSEFVKENENDIYDLDDVICKAGALGEYKALYDELYEDDNEIKACLYLYEVIRVLKEANEGEILTQQEIEELTDCLLCEKNFDWYDTEGIELFDDLNQVIEALNLR